MKYPRASRALRQAPDPMLKRACFARTMLLRTIGNLGLSRSGLPPIKPWIRPCHSFTMFKVTAQQSTGRIILTLRNHPIFSAVFPFLKYFISFLPASGETKFAKCEISVNTNGVVTQELSGTISLQQVRSDEALQNCAISFLGNLDTIRELICFITLFSIHMSSINFSFY